jgi:hypothetical protein
MFLRRFENTRTRLLFKKEIKQKKKRYFWSKKFSLKKLLSVKFLLMRALLDSTVTIFLSFKLERSGTSRIEHRCCNKVVRLVN